MANQKRPKMRAKTPRAMPLDRCEECEVTEHDTCPLVGDCSCCEQSRESLEMMRAMDPNPEMSDWDTHAE